MTRVAGQKMLELLVASVRATTLTQNHSRYPCVLMRPPADATRLSRPDIITWVFPRRAFGAMLYEMITGRKGFAGSSQATLIVAVMSVNPPAISTIQPMASPALDRVVRRCLTKWPHERRQCADDLLSELEWIAESGDEAESAAPAAAKRRFHERMWQPDQINSRTCPIRLFRNLQVSEHSTEKRLPLAHSS